MSFSVCLTPKLLDASYELAILHSSAILHFLHGDGLVHIGCRCGCSGGLGVDFLNGDPGASVDD